MANQTCHDCGAKLEEGAKFCGECGSLVKTENKGIKSEQIENREPVKLTLHDENNETEIKNKADAQLIEKAPEPKEQKSYDVLHPYDSTQNNNAPPKSNNSRPAEPDIPKQYKPCGILAYIGLFILFAIPIIGFISMIAFSLSNSNLSRRNYARAMLTMTIISTVLFVVIGRCFFYMYYDIIEDLFNSIVSDIGYLIPVDFMDISVKFIG